MCRLPQAGASLETCFTELPVLWKSHTRRAPVQAAGDLVGEVERAVERYSGGMGFLGQRLPLPGPPQLLLITHARTAGHLGGAQPLGGDAAGAGVGGGACSGAPAEAVACAAPQWGAGLAAPASWDAAQDVRRPWSPPPVL